MSVKMTATEKLVPHSFKWEVQASGETKYLLYLPPGYDGNATNRWPLMLFLHGAGERGNDAQTATIHGPLSMVKQGKSFPFIIAAPLFPENQRWHTEPLLKLLDHLEATLRVDKTRVYLTGLSMGGYGTWDLALAHPGRFAAAIPICGGGELIDAILSGRDQEHAFKSLPIWAFHGAKDPVVPVSESERMVMKLKELGVYEVKLTIYPEAQHNSWTETYNNPEVYEWLLKHSRADRDVK